jgi:hypothetical protein
VLVDFVYYLSDLILAYFLILPLSILISECLSKISYSVQDVRVTMFVLRCKLAVS